MSLSEALIDMRDEVIAGAAAEDAAGTVAADHNLNPALLIRKFRESHPTDEGVRANHGGQSIGQYVEGRRQEEIARQCRRYGVNPSSVKLVTFKGKVYSLIGFTSRDYGLGVSHENGSSWKLPARGIVVLEQKAA